MSRRRIGVWLCCVVYRYNDGTTDLGEPDADTRDFGLCPNCGGFALYRGWALDGVEEKAAS